MMIYLGMNKHYTHIEFPLQSHQVNLVPRLFTAKRDAAVARTWWLKGVTKTVWDNGDGWERDPACWMDTIAKPDRKPEDMEVVEVLLTVQRNT